MPNPCLSRLYRVDLLSRYQRHVVRMGDRHPFWSARRVVRELTDKMKKALLNKANFKLGSKLKVWCTAMGHLPSHTHPHRSP